MLHFNILNKDVSKKLSQEDSILTETLNILDGNQYIGINNKQCTEVDDLTT